MRFLPPLLAASLAYGLAACARTPPPPPPEAAATPPPVRIADGTYVGSSTRFRADARGCASPGRVTLRVLDGGFSYRLGRQTIQADVALDGAVSGTTGDIRLIGRADGQRIVGDVDTPACGYHFTTTRREPRVLSPNRP